jgi:hypothetical protein
LGRIYFDEIILTLKTDRRSSIDFNFNKIAFIKKTVEKRMIENKPFNTTDFVTELMPEIVTNKKLTKPIAAIKNNSFKKFFSDAALSL